jgi:hypothetical protein
MQDVEHTTIRTPAQGGVVDDRTTTIFRSVEEQLIELNDTYERLDRFYYEALDEEEETEDEERSKRALHWRKTTHIASRRSVQ